MLLKFVVVFRGRGFLEEGVRFKLEGMVSEKKVECV